MALAWWGLIWSYMARNPSYIDLMGKVVSTKGNLGNIDAGLTIASGGNRVALYLFSIIFSEATKQVIFTVCPVLFIDRAIN